MNKTGHDILCNIPSCNIAFAVIVFKQRKTKGGKKF